MEFCLSNHHTKMKAFTLAELLGDSYRHNNNIGDCDLIDQTGPYQECETVQILEYLLYLLPWYLSILL